MAADDLLKPFKNIQRCHLGSCLSQKSLEKKINKSTNLFRIPLVACLVSWWFGFNYVGLSLVGLGGFFFGVARKGGQSVQHEKRSKTSTLCQTTKTKRVYFDVGAFRLS